MKQKRKYRELEKSTVEKIQKSLKGLTKSEAHKKAISTSMKAYWATIPNKPVDQQDISKSINPLIENEK